MAKPDPFFDVPHPASITKARIVAKYFVAWAGIMAHQHDKIAYLDLFSGPGAYADGTPSTPLLVMGAAAAKPLIASRLVSIFNDVNEDSAQKLEHALASVPGIDKLTYDPKIMNADVSDEVITELEDLQKMVPSLSFIDPYGYRGLTLNLIGRVVRDWGCEVIFFFNYQRINAAISNPEVRKHMEALFTAERLAELQTELASAKKDDRPDVIFQHLGGRLEELGGTYQRPFLFRLSNGRLLRSLMFVSKSPLGYDIMKGVMANEGLKDPDGVSTFTFYVDGGGLALPLDGAATPYQVLLDELPSQFAGRTLTRKEVFEEHNVGTPYVKANYLKALIELEENGAITCDPAADERRAGTMAEDRVSITFP